MKKLLVILFMMMPLVSVAQNFNEDGGKYEVYCEVEYIFMGDLIYIKINKKRYCLINKDNEKIRIKYPVEVINLLAKRGWKLVAIGASGDRNTNRRYLMKKEVVDDKEIELGLKEEK